MSSRKLKAGALFIGMLMPVLASANVGAAIHVPSGRIYVKTGTEPYHQLQVQALKACGQKELNGDKTKANECVTVKNFSAGPCDSQYAKGNSYVTIGGYPWQATPGLNPKAGQTGPNGQTPPPPAGYSAFMHCGRTQEDADKGFERHCGSPGCTIWQRLSDPDNH